MPSEHSAGAVVFREERKQRFYLVLHYEAGHWSFPKGNIEKGESLKETVVREVEEETGITDLKFIPDFKEIIKYFYKREEKKIFKTVAYFLAETQTKEVEISWEHTNFKWLSYEKAKEQVTYKNAERVLQRAEDFLRDR